MQDNVALEVISQVIGFPQTITLWHIEYFKLKKSEKRHMHEGLFDFPPKQVLKPSCEKCLL